LKGIWVVSVIVSIVILGTLGLTQEASSGNGAFIKVTKVTIPAGEAGPFGVEISSSDGGNVVESTSQLLPADGDTFTWQVDGDKTYDISEFGVPADFVETSNTCVGLVTSAPATEECTITNTKILTKVAPGFDLFQTEAPTDFFGFPFEGVPLGTFDFGLGPVDVGNADTIVERLDSSNGVSIPDTAPPIDIELVALQLKSVAPVDLGCGVDDYFIVLDDPTPSLGTMTITFDTLNDGTFDSFFSYEVDLRTGALDGPICSSHSLPLTSGPASWNRTSPPGAVLIPGVNHLLGIDTSQDFWPDPFTLLGSSHSVAPATFPPKPVGGTGISTDTVSLLAYGIQSNAVWWLPLVLAGVGIGVFVIKKRN